MHRWQNFFRLIKYQQIGIDDRRIAFEGVFQHSERNLMSPDVRRDDDTGRDITSASSLALVMKKASLQVLKQAPPSRY